MKKKHFALCLSLIVLVMVSACGTSKKEELPIVYGKCTYAFDVTNLELLVGDADYVFAGTVRSMNGTEYRSPYAVVENGEEVTKYVPYTRYTVRVEDNVKGEFPINEDLEIIKCGGLDESGEFYSVLEGDFLPEVGRTYIFVAYEQEDESILVCGVNSNIILDESNTTSLRADNGLQNNSTFQEFVIAYENSVRNNAGEIND